jgi:hypothetical protein
MNSSKAHKTWIEQCEATQTIRARFGLKAAFDYLVGEKLINFAEAASRHRDFAQVPRFISEVRRMFTPEEIGARLTCIEGERDQEEEDVLDEDDPLDEDPTSIAERVSAVSDNQGIIDRNYAWHFVTNSSLRNAL